METKNELKAVKEFNHPAEKVFSAWTEPEQLKQWWHPMNAKLTEVKNDLKEGGEIEYRFTAGEQESFSITGEYSEVKPNELLVYSWKWHLPHGEDDYKLSVHFISTEAGCRLEVVQENFEHQEQVEPHQQGWEHGLSNLASFLDGGNNSRPAGTINDHIPIVGYGSSE
ncbi:SRPBCC family protein [Desertivirga xinjiangensis]|uniref:SRPBCC family protein n=1 Tax=Desertivirga xinjiangensis TaxID=539206 RepID=UPI002109D809|nr:SRPBCC domain-containing protein [Pedobacter xinjiangensis]